MGCGVWQGSGQLAGLQGGTVCLGWDERRGAKNSPVPGTSVYGAVHQSDTIVDLPRHICHKSEHQQNT